MLSQEIKVIVFGIIKHISKQLLRLRDIFVNFYLKKNKKKLRERLEIIKIISSNTYELVIIKLNMRLENEVVCRAPASNLHFSSECR